MKTKVNFTILQFQQVGKRPKVKVVITKITNFKKRSDIKRFVLGAMGIKTNHPSLYRMYIYDENGIEQQDKIDNGYIVVIFLDVKRISGSVSGRGLFH